MSEKRILDESSTSQVASDDYVYMDGQTNGSRKITPDNLVRGTSVYETLTQHIADAAESIAGIEGDIDTMQQDINDVKSDIGDLADLETEDKSSLVNAINEARGSGGSGLTADIKTALLQIAQKVAYIDDDGQDYYGDLYDAFYPSVTSISAVYTQSGTVYSTTALNSLKSDLVVTANYGDGTTARLADTDYTLSGTLTVGTSTVTVTYGDKTTTFTVTVTGVVSIDAVYTQSGVITDSNTLSDLIPDLVVTATLSDSSTFIVPSSDYTLSGTLESGTSTITVTYGTLTDTFTVTVTEVIDYTLNPLNGITWTDNFVYDNNTGYLIESINEHCTEKFTAQSCVYLLTNSDTTNNTNIVLYAWDADNAFLGYCQMQSSPSLFSLKKGQKYAIKAYNTTGSFDASTITFMPQDNSATASSEFSIRLSDYIGNITANTSDYEINISSVMSNAGITASNVRTKINRCDHLAIITPKSSPARGKNLVGREFAWWLYNINTVMFVVKNVPTQDLTSLAAWITANDPIIRFNY